MFGYAAFAQPTFGGLGSALPIAYVANITEALAFADVNIVPAFYSAAVTEALTSTDSSIYSITYGSVITETITFADSLAVLTSSVVSVNENIVCDESPTTYLIYLKNIFENINVNLQNVQQPAAFGGLPFSGSAFGGNDNTSVFASTQDASVVWSVGTTITESISSADIPSGVKIQNAIVSEGLSLLDSLSIIAAFIASNTEILTLNDISGRSGIYPQTVFENININLVSNPQAAAFSGLPFGGSAFGGLFDSFLSTENASVVKSTIASITENLSFQDAPSLNVFFRAVSEAMSMGDAQTVVQFFAALITENIAVQDVNQVQKITGATQIENITVADVLLAAAWIKINDTQSTDWTLIDNRQ
jgi:hypothetical protein